jgi:hypothetical protein
MLNIIKLKIKNVYKNITLNKKYTDFIYKESGSIIRNWKNSIYVYNKNNITLISIINDISINLIRNYFKGYLSKKRNFATRLRLKKYLNSKHKFFLSDAQLKHTNDLVNITIYFYDPTMHKYLYQLKKKKIFLIKKNIILKWLNKGGEYYKFKQSVILKNILLNNLTRFDFKNLKFFRNFYSNLFLYKSLKIAKLYLNILQLIYINKSKFRNNYLQDLVNIIKKLYKKNVEFNFVNIKYYFFNSEFIAQRFIFDIKRDRKYLNHSIRNIIINLPIKKNRLIYQPKLKYIFNTKYIFKLRKVKKNLDITNTHLYNLLLKNKTKSNSLKKTIFDNIKYKKVEGLKLQANGRLTRRFTAARSLGKNKIRGSLTNFNSSFFGQSSSLLRGNFKSNIDYTSLNNNTPLGSFGIKGWLSGF